jgi:hypothetical protein
MNLWQINQPIRGRLHFCVIQSCSEPHWSLALRDNLTVKEPQKDRRHSSRMNQSRTVRIRPAESQYAEEIRTTLNLSWDGFYFATSTGHYFSGMIVYVTCDFRSNDLTNRETQGTVVRVDKLKKGRWGVAIQMAGGAWKNKIT